MSWSDPLWLVLFAVLVPLGALIAWSTRAHHARLLALFGGLTERVLPTSTRRRRTARDLMTWLGLALAVVALAGPRAGKVLQKVEADGVDLVIVLDLSVSMDARDVDPSRLERARREVRDLLDVIEGDRIGLVIFAGGAYPRMPLTLDRGALALVISELDSSVFEAQGSAVGLAIDEGLRMLEGDVDDAGRALLLITDGEVHDPGAAVAAAQRAAAANVAIYGMIVGSEAAPIPQKNGTFLTDPKTGTQVMTQPSQDVLTDLARTTGGAIVQSVASDLDVRQLYAEIRAGVRAGNRADGEQETWNQLHGWPLSLGALLLLAAAWLGDGRRIALAAAMLLSLGSASVARAGDVWDGDRLYREGKFQEAVQVFTELSRENPDDADLLQRLGAARYRAGDFTGAARAYERAAQLSGDPNAKFDAGNAWWRGGALDRALGAYDEALRADPEHPGATRNRELLQSEIQERRQQQQQQQQQQGPGDPSEPPQSDGQQGDGQQGEGPSDKPPEGAQPEGPPEDGPPSETPPGQQGDGPPPDAAAQGEADQGKPGEEQPSEPSTSESTQGESDGTADGTRKEAGEAGEVRPDQLDGAADPGETDGQGGASAAGDAPTGGQESSGDRAGRTLDSVEEGRPRTYIPGRTQEKPW